MNWRLEPRTEKQSQAIVNMQVALGSKVDIPDTKGECSDLINKLQKAITNNLQVVGVINPNHYNDSDDDNFGPMENFPFG